MSSVTALQHLGNTLVLGGVQAGWNYKIASSTELRSKLLTESGMKCLLELVTLLAYSKLSELTHNCTLMPKQVN